MKKIVCVVIIAALLIGGCAWYVNDYYALDEAAVFTVQGSTFETYEQGGWHVYAPENPKAGLVFYPGGKVDAPAYGPLMEACAARDILCVLVEMPLRLAILDADAGAEVPEAFPQVEKWYIGGHSLGGSMAASCLAGHPGMFEGLVLLAAYSADDLSKLDVRVLSVVGSEDGVLNRQKYENGKAMLPADFEEVTIEGGCHAGFGLYGPQAGDGTPAITHQEQILITAQRIDELIEK